MEITLQKMVGPVGCGNNAPVLRFWSILELGNVEKVTANFEIHDERLLKI
ncbi:hypothetical protein [Haliea sp. E17]